jgi:hypothetical protein
MLIWSSAPAATDVSPGVHRSGHLKPGGRDRSTPGFEVDDTLLSCADADPVWVIYFFIESHEICAPGWVGTLEWRRRCCGAGLVS